MPLKRFLIAPLTEGLVNALLPWLIPDNAYARLNNVYLWRARLKKRFGSVWLENTNDPNKSRLRYNQTTIDGAGNASGTTVTGANSFVGQQFSVLDVIYTSVVPNGAMLVSSGPSTATYDTTTGNFTITGSTAPMGTIVYFYPCLPAMGATTYESTSPNFIPTVMFDTVLAYTYSLATGAFDVLGTTATTWTGSDTDFFWCTTFRNTDTQNTANNINVLFVTNNVNVVRFWDATAWTDFRPLVRNVSGTMYYVETTKIIVQFKGRLIFLNTTETGGQNFANRCRYSWTQSVINNPNDAFFEASGKGGYIDASTSEAIVSAEFVKDRLVVSFESSKYQLAYTGAPDAPFAWLKIDNNYGSASTLADVSFNNIIVGVGTQGIIECNGATVKRIDSKIPQEVFDIRASNRTFQRVVGIRDFYEEMIYWTFPSTVTQNASFPQRVLVYDYVSGNWAFNDDSFTIFGYHYKTTGLTWATWHTPWQDSNWPWNSSSNSARTKTIIAGNQQGYVVNIQSDISSNIPAMSIVNLIGNQMYIKEANVQLNEFLLIDRCLGSTNLNGKIVRVDDFTVNSDGITVVTINQEATGTYVGGGVVARVSRIDILTKQYNFFTDGGQNTFIPYVEYLVTNQGKGMVPSPTSDKPTMKVDYFVSTSDLSMVQQANLSGAAFGDQGGNILDLYPYDFLSIEVSQDRFWRRVYFQAEGQTIQMRIYYDDTMMVDPTISLQDFQLHAMLIYAAGRGTRFRG